MSQYNATIRSFRKDQETGEEIPWGTFVGKVQEINGWNQILRSNWITCTGYEDRFFTSDGEIEGIQYREGDSAYDLALRLRNPNLRFEVSLDNCEGYRNLLGGTNLPPAYRV